MNHGPLIFLGLFTALALSWFGMIVQPQLQLGRSTQATNVVDNSQLYPTARPGLAQQGQQVYRSLGCATCHSQQVRQDGALLNVILRSVGTNTEMVVNAVHRLRPESPLPEAGRLISQLPATVLSGLEDPEQATLAAKSLTEAGAKAEVHLTMLGPDIERGWGRGRSVAADFLQDQPALPGQVRLGPDLANVGERLPGKDWHYVHLYDPKSVVPKSVMPPYRFLFEKRFAGENRSPDALLLGPEQAAAVGEGFEVVPTDEARALVAYLLSLRTAVPLIERPISSGPEVDPASAPETTNPTSVLETNLPSVPAS